MSVLIKGMEMPQRCMGCTLCYVGHMGDLMCEVLRRPINVDETGRDRFCPLIEVHTPHGRLIDADKLDIHDISPVDGFCVMGVTEEDIGLADTVIKAEGET